MALAHKFDEAKVKRDKDGQFAKKAFTGGPSWLKSIKGKQPPKSFKFYKPGYSPKAKGSITGVNASSDGKTLWGMKKAGAFDNDYEFWLAAGKLAAAYKKNHGSNAATPHSIVNMAFHHEMEETGKPPAIGKYSGPEFGAPKGGKSAAELNTDEKHTYAKTSGGLQVKSKYLAPGDLVPTGKKMAGVNGALVYKDSKDQEWLVKFPGGSKGSSKAYSNSLFLVDLDVATSRIQSKAGLPVPSIHAKTVDGKTASVHKMYSRVQDAFPTHSPNLKTMDEADIREIQKNMVLDWLLSNHDPHTGNFLKTDKGIIGIDKGQSFKYFGKDKLTTSFGSDLNPPLAPNKPVYSTLMQQHQNGQGELFDFNGDPEISKTITRLMAIPDDDYRELLRPYAEKGKKAGLLNYPGKTYGDSDEEAVSKFLEAAVARKNNLSKDFAQLNSQLNSKTHDSIAYPDKSAPLSQQPSPYVQTLKSNFESGVMSKSAFLNAVDDAKTQTFISVDEASYLKGLAAASAAPAAPKKLKLEDELAKDMSAVEVGDYLKYKGGTSVEVVGVSPHSVSLANGQLIGATDFDMGSIDWGAKPAPKDDIGKGYAVVQDGNTLKWKIKKPTGEFSKNKNGDEKTWDSKEEALASSTAAKYKAQAAQQEQYAAQQLQSQLAGAVSEATSAPDIPDPSQSTATGMKMASNLSMDEAKQYISLKQKIMSGQHTSDEYVAFKTLKSKVLAGKKAEGAAQIEDDFDGGFAAVAPAPAAPKKAKGGFKETPKFKLKGGAPPEISQAKGPNVVSLGEQLWAMKKAGQIQDDYQMWNAANKLSNADKKAALAKNPNAVVGVDYSSKNAIRNVAMRLEFDETGDVAWNTLEELTSSEVGQTFAEIKKSLSLQDHVPVKKASSNHFFSPHFNNFDGEFDSAKAVGSYQNPHSFKYGDTQAVNAYGYTYTDHNNWDQQQKSAWYSFSGSGSSIINTFFRTGDVGMYGNFEYTKGQAKNIVDAFKSKNVKPLDDWTTVVRGTSGGWELGIGADVVSFEDMKAMEGKVVRNKCPVSSSLRDKPPWGSYRITYKLPPGFPMLALLGKSAHPGEQEVLLPPGMAYRIKQVKKGNGHYQHEVLVEVVDVKLPEIA